MWSTRKELEAVLAQAGLGEWSPRLAAAARHAIILEPGPVEEGADAPIGASRLGGMPDLPPEVRWPWRPALPNSAWEHLRENLRDFFRHDIAHSARPWPLSFIAQVDFAEIHSAGGLEGFTSSGRLLFFCDPVLYEDQACTSVMFLDEPADKLGRRDFPAEFSHPGEVARPEDFTFRSRRLTPNLWLLPPPWRSRELLALNGVSAPQGWSKNGLPRCWREKERAAYDQFWQEHHLDDTIHQVGGIPFAWGKPVET